MRAATPPAGEKETKDRELQALKDAHAAIGRRLDALFGQGGGKQDDDDDRRDARSDDDDDDRKDDAEEEGEDKEKKEEEARSDDDDDDRRDARRDAGDRGVSMKDRGRKDRGRRDAGIENFKGKQAAPFKDSGRKDKEKDIEEWAGEEKEEPWHKEEEKEPPSDKEKPTPLAADRKDDDEEEGGDEGRSDDDDDRRDDRRDARRDTRADSSSLRRRIEALERGATDEEIERLAEEQQLWSEPAMAHGERVSRPMHGESLLSYVRRNARHFQRYSDKWKGVDLRQLPVAALKIAAPEIRKDAVSAAYRVEPGAEPMLREVIKPDRTGRRISEFVGPVSAMLDQFRMPSFRVRRINTQPNPF
jgi:hypothetical protein